MQIPESEKLTTQCLGRVFDNTVATYKYYWFLGILDLFVKKGQTRINVWDIMISMVVNAWYPVNYFRLSFGKNESLYQTILQLQKQYEIPINLSVSELIDLFEDLVKNKEVRKQMAFLKQNVPFRFLRPWIDTSDDKEMVVRSQSLENGCLYKLIRDQGELWVELNSVWLDYLQRNYCILKDFTYWNLTLFLQVRNPNVPNIPNKLVKSAERNSLLNQHKFWNAIIKTNKDFRCIYTNKPIVADDYELDHFVPWSFVSHDLLWNLVPADSSINSSKNNKLPDLEIYLPKLTLVHQSALTTYLSMGKSNKLVEDYLSLGCTPQELVSMDYQHLCDCFKKTFAPLNQIALNMGFESWKFKG